MLDRGDLDRVSQEARKALDQIEFPRVDRLPISCRKTAVVAGVRVSGEHADSRPATAAPEDAGRVSEDYEKTLINPLAVMLRSQFLVREGYRILHNVSQGVTNMIRLSISSTQRTENIQPDISTVGKGLNGPSATNTKPTDFLASRKAVPLLQHAIGQVCILQEQNDMLKVEIDGLHAQIADLKSLKDTSEALNDTLDRRLNAEDTEKSALERHLMEEVTENFELHQKHCQQAKKASRQQAELRSFGTQSFHRVVLLSQMLTHFGVDTRDEDHSILSRQAMNYVGIAEKKIFEGLEKQARKARTEMGTLKFLKGLQTQKEIEMIEVCMAESMIDENRGLRWHENSKTWVDIQTGKEPPEYGLRDDDLLNDMLTGEGRQEECFETIGQMSQDPRWMAGLEIYNRYLQSVKVQHPSKEELDSVYRVEEDDNFEESRDISNLDQALTGATVGSTEAEKEKTETGQLSRANPVTMPGKGALEENAALTDAIIRTLPTNCCQLNETEPVLTVSVK